MCGTCGNVHKTAVGPYAGYPVGCCDFKDGYYCIWTLNHATMECEEWVELCDFRAVLHTVAHITFNVVLERSNARTALTNMKREAPFAECKRFPWRKTFVNVSCSVYASMLQDLLTSLDFKDRETEKELRYGFNHKQDDKDQNSSASSSLDDSKTRFRNTLKKLQNALCKKDEVYDRVKFEAKYDLRWCVGPCPNGPGGEPDNPDNPNPNPNLPLNRTYGEMMRRMKSKGLEPSDFSVFTADDMKKNDFACGREIQALGPSLEAVKLPKSAVRVFVFPRGEYTECADEGSEVQGYIYDQMRNTLDGPVDLKRYRELEKIKVFSGLEDIDLDSDQWRKIICAIKSSVRDEVREEEELVEVSDCV